MAIAHTAHRPTAPDRPVIGRLPPLPPSSVVVVATVVVATVVVGDVVTGGAVVEGGAVVVVVGGACGTTLFDAADAGPVPTLFVAVTVNV